MADGDVYQHYMNVYRPVYTTLVEVLMRKVQYPENSVFEKLSSEEREQLRCYRQDISDTIVSLNLSVVSGLILLMDDFHACVSNSITLKMDEANLNEFNHIFSVPEYWTRTTKKTWLGWLVDFFF